MPTLPLHGQDDDDDEDHDHTDLMNEDEDDEEGDDDDDMTDERDTPSGFVSEEDETVEDGAGPARVRGQENSSYAQQNLSSHLLNGSGNMDKQNSQPSPTQQYVPSSSIASILELLDRTAAENESAAATRRSTNASHARLDSEGHASVSRSSSESGGSGSSGGLGSARAGAGANGRDKRIEAEDIATPTVHRKDYFSAPLSNVDNSNRKEDFASSTTPTPTARTAFGRTGLPTRKDIGGDAGSSFSSSLAMGIASTLRVSSIPAAGSRPTTLYANDAPRQRPGLYHQTSKMLAKGGELDIDPLRREASWKRLDFEEATSMDFALGGRYGNEIAKGLAVSTNPTAKLCGQMVREAMKKEYGPAFSG